EVAAAAGRFEAAGLPYRTSAQELCCHAVQDKLYVEVADAPLGQWEFYTILDDAPADTSDDPSSACCPTAGADTACCQAPADIPADAAMESAQRTGIRSPSLDTAEPRAAESVVGGPQRPKEHDQGEQASLWTVSSPSSQPPLEQSGGAGDGQGW
ncbi:MAG: hypothetical protein M3314_02170, partial [Actinomycetota bacterium]|nr:hypothetical protein [Actinomycetota bacterium]